MKLNNKGFVATALLYSLLVIFLFLIVGLLAMLSNRKMILDKLKGDVKNELNGMTKYKVYENGTAIYYNPVTNKLCSDYTEENSLNENKTGCMKWYIFNDNINKSTVNMILDHNTTNAVAWNSSGNNEDGMNEVKTALENDTKNWNISARLITADEVAHIVGADTDDTIKWKSSKGYGDNDIETKVSWFYLNASGTSYSSSNGWKKRISTEKSTNEYAWLFDYTSNCEDYGCNINRNNNYGYWTSTRVNGASSNIQAWFVYSIGSLDYALITRTDIGVRPVITLNKKELTKPFTVVYDYTGSSQSFVRPVPGNYKIELWGASGYEGDAIVASGKGAYALGIINIKENNSLYVYVGSGEKSRSFIFNGGAPGEASGGGATDIRLINGDWNNFNSLQSRIIVAGGGGGGFHRPNTSNHKSGNAGGLEGYDADADYSNQSQSPLLEKGYSGHGATQASFGFSSITSTAQSYLNAGYHVVNAGFGYGGYGNDNNNNVYSSGGGSGYYGGGHGVHPGSTWSGGGGGSSFISGHNGCVAITEDSTEDNIKQRKDSGNNVCTDGTTDITCSYHYSGYKFTDTVMIDGAGCKWTTEKTNDCSGMPTHDGTSTMTGNTGNGYAKITYLGE